MTRQEMVKQRKANAEFIYKSAQSLEYGTIGIKTTVALGVLTPAEKQVMEKAERLGLKAAKIARTVALRAERSA